MTEEPAQQPIVVNTPILQESLPNSTAVLILGIFSIASCCCCGIPGLIFSIIALVMEAKDNARYKEDPKRYIPSSYSNLNAGRTCAFVGLILSLIFLIFFIIPVFYVGTIDFSFLEDFSILDYIF